MGKFSAVKYCDLDRRAEPEGWETLKIINQLTSFSQRIGNRKHFN